MIELRHWIAKHKLVQSSSTLLKLLINVPHKILLSKLTSYGITGKTHNWITYFLSNRKQRVSVNVALRTSHMYIWCPTWLSSGT